MDEHELRDRLRVAAGAHVGAPIDGIRRRAASLRRRRRALAGSAAIAALAFALPLFGSAGEDGSLVVTDHDVTSTTTDTADAATRESSTTTSSTSSTSAPAITTTSGPGGEGTGPVRPPAAGTSPPEAATTTTEPCLGAANRPECGPPFFTYQGPNLPATLALSASPTAASVRIEAAWADPDFSRLECWFVDFGDGSPILAGPDLEHPDGTGPGDCRTNEFPDTCERMLSVGNGPQPFEPSPGSRTVVVDHAYAPGSYVVTFSARSTTTMCPTASDVSATLTVSVP